MGGWSIGDSWFPHNSNWWPEVIAALGDEPERLPYLEPGTEKRSFPDHFQFFRKTPPSREIYLLNEDHSKEIVPLPPTRGVIGTAYAIPTGLVC